MNRKQKSVFTELGDYLCKFPSIFKTKKSVTVKDLSTFSFATSFQMIKNRSFTSFTVVVTNGSFIVIYKIYISRLSLSIFLSKFPSMLIFWKLLFLTTLHLWGILLQSGRSIPGWGKLLLKFRNKPSSAKTAWNSTNSKISKILFSWAYFKIAQYYIMRLPLCLLKVASMNMKLRPLKFIEKWSLSHFLH